MAAATEAARRQQNVDQTSTRKVLEEHLIWFPAHIASLLSVSDAMRWCTSTRSLRTLRLRELLQEDGTLPPDWQVNGSWSRSDDIYHAHRWQVLLNGDLSSKAHSAFVTMDWRDQGWGNQKGMVSVVDEGPSGVVPSFNTATSAWTGPHAPNDYKVSGPWVVAEKSPAPHTYTTLKLSFKPADSSVYSLWRRIGGGGGHSLKLESCRVFILEFV